MRSILWRFCAITAAAAPGLAASVCAHAQLVASATVESQYRLRGIALTNDEPDVRLGLAYDHPSGAYAGASLIGGQTVHDNFRGLGFIAYLGFAEGIGDGASWDAGATISEINLYLSPSHPLAAPPYASQVEGYAPMTVGNGPEADTIHYRADYSQIYGGISWQDTSVHLYASPDYLGEDLRTLYLDVTETFRPMAHLRLYGHAGALTPLAAATGRGNEHYDLGTGTAWEWHHGEIQLAWTGISPQVQYPPGYPQKRSALILSVTGFF